MNEESKSSDISEKLKLVNWPGLAAGVLMLLLPLLGAWWRAVAGDGVFVIAISPFYYNIEVVGQVLTSPLVGYVLLGAKLTVWIGGAFLIAGSVFSSKWWGRKLVSWGAMKVFWMLIGLVILFTAGVYLANRFIPTLISGMGGSGVSITSSLPYFSGSGFVEIQRESVMTVRAPVFLNLTKYFWIAVATAGLGLGTRIYNGRIEDKVTPEEPEEEEEVSEEPEEEEEVSEESEEQKEESDISEDEEDEEESSEESSEEKDKEPEKES